MKIGPYEVLGTLGQGAMGVVFKARSEQGDVVAIKLLTKTDVDTLARFDRERRLIGSFTARDGFVPLLDAGVTNDDRPYLVLSLCSGGTLRSRLKGGPLSVEETIDLGRALAKALATAHERGIVHRDLKPENILFSHRGAESGDWGRPLVADLGIAKHFSHLVAGASQTVSLSAGGVMFGTFYYMAPEQAEDAKGAGPPADVFALGAILHECLTGEMAFTGDSVVEVLWKIASQKAAPLATARPDAPAWLREAIERCLVVDKTKRFENGAALLAALEHPAGKKNRGGRGLLVVGGGLVAVLAVAALVGIKVRGSSVPPPPPPPRPLPHVADTTPVATRVSPEVAPADRAEVPALWDRAGERMKAGDYDGAIADLDRILTFDPRFAAGWNSRGSLKARKRDFAGALEDLNRAITLDWKLVGPWGLRGDIRQLMGQVDEAIVDLTMAIALNPAMAPLWISRGAARQRRGDNEGSIADSTQAIELDPRSVAAWTQRGGTREETGDLEGAIADAGHAIALDASYVHAWANRGAAREKKGDLEGAINDSTQAIALDPKLAGPWTERGRAKARLGDLDGAIVDLKHAIELAPTSRHVPAIRKRIAEIEAERSAR